MLHKIAFMLLGLLLGFRAVASPDNCHYPSSARASAVVLVQDWIANLREHTDEQYAFDCARVRFVRLKEDLFDYQARAHNPLTRAFLKPREFEQSRALLLNQFADDIDRLLARPDVLTEHEMKQLQTAIFDITTELLEGKGMLVNLDALSNRYLVGASRIVAQFNHLHLGYARAYTLDNDRNYQYFYFVVTVYEDNLVLSQNFIE